MRQSQNGFTLVELLMTIALVSILVSIAVPNLQRFVQNSRMTSQANEINAFLSLARTEALQAYAPAFVSPTTAGDWTSDWIVWVDTNGNGSYDGGEERAQMEGVEAGNFSMVDDSAAAVDELSFDPRGWPARGATMSFEPPNCSSSDEFGRQITLRPTGSIRVAKCYCGACP